MDIELIEAIAGLVLAIGGVASVIITKVIVPFIRAKTTREQRALAYGIVEAAVGYAEQMGKSGEWDSTKKKFQAITWSLDQIQKAGLDIQEDTLNVWIEDAVNKLGASLEQLMTLEEAEAEVGDRP